MRAAATRYPIASTLDSRPRTRVVARQQVDTLMRLEHSASKGTGDPPMDVLLLDRRHRSHQRVPDECVPEAKAMRPPNQDLGVDRGLKSDCARLTVGGEGDDVRVELSGEDGAELEQASSLLGQRPYLRLDKRRHRCADHRLEIGRMPPGVTHDS